MKYLHKLKTMEIGMISKIGPINWAKDLDLDKKRRYKAFHTWLSRNFEKPRYCELCGRFTELQWANISQEYFEDRRDYFCLCKKCHLDFDYWCERGFMFDRPSN